MKRRLASRLHVPLVLTPFLHLGDPDEPDDPTRRAYIHPALLNLARSGFGWISTIAPNCSQRTLMFTT